MSVFPIKCEHLEDRGCLSFIWNTKFKEGLMSEWTWTWHLQRISVGKGIIEGMHVPLECSTYQTFNPTANDKRKFSFLQTEKLVI